MRAVYADTANIVKIHIKPEVVPVPLAFFRSAYYFSFALALSRFLFVFRPYGYGSYLNQPRCFPSLFIGLGLARAGEGESEAPLLTAVQFESWSNKVKPSIRAPFSARAW